MPRGGAVTAAVKPTRPAPAAANGVTSFPLTPEQEIIRDGFRRKEDMVIAAGAGTGKALRDDQLVQTPNGPVPIASLRVGDEVIGSNGLPTRVTGVFPQGVRQLFEVVTCDGVSIIADGDHRWKVTVEAEKVPSRTAVYTTRQILTMMSAEMTARLPVLSAPAVIHSTAKVPSPRTAADLLNASVDERAALVSDTMSRFAVGDVVSVPSNEAQGFATVVRSLGGTAEIRVSRSNGTTPIRVQCPAVTPDVEVVRRIVNITEVESASATCISVDAEDKLFATEGFVLTHNTSTITMLAEDLYATDKTATGVYLAFNVSIAKEVSGKFFYRNVQGMTVHSLANRALRSMPDKAPLLDKLGRYRGGHDRPYRVYEMPKAFGIGELKVLKDPSKPVHPNTNPILLQVQPQTLCREAGEAITKWCQSADDEIGPEHVHLENSKLGKEMKAIYRKEIARVAKIMWDTDICSPTGRLYFSHDHYLKMYSLMDPDIHEQMGFGNRRSVLFFDEAQDSRPCITRIVMAQREKMQVILCGDSSQSIYRFTGCRDALAGFRKFDGVHTYTLSKTFRFGRHIAAVANQILAQIIGSDLRIIPDLTIPSKVSMAANNVAVVRVQHGSYPDAVICRTNFDLIDTAIAYMARGVRVFCMTDVDRIRAIAEDIVRLEKGMKTQHPEMRKYTSKKELQNALSKRRVDALGVSTTSDDDDDDMEVEDTLLPIILAAEKFGAANVVKSMNNAESSEDAADVLVSTIHKSKGRQWDTVHVRWDGFSTQSKSDQAVKDNLMLLYVAATRAKLHLILGESLGMDIEIPSALTTESETLGYVKSMHPSAPADIADDMDAYSIPPHKLVEAVVFAQNEIVGETVPREERGLLALNLIAEVGLDKIFEMIDLVESGMPAALVANMFDVQGKTRATDKVREVLTSAGRF